LKCTSLEEILLNKNSPQHILMGLKQVIDIFLGVDDHDNDNSIDDNDAVVMIMMTMMMMVIAVKSRLTCIVHVFILKIADLNNIVRK
jgi:hypothetical protein